MCYQNVILNCDCSLFSNNILCLKLVLVIEVDKLTRLWYRVIDFVIFPIHKYSIYRRSRPIEYVITIYELCRISFSHQDIKKT